MVKTLVLFLVLKRAGLENTEVVRSNALITVPVNPNFSSINLAQTVLLLSYEWFFATDIYEENFSNNRKTSVASILEIEKAFSAIAKNELEKLVFSFRKKSYFYEEFTKKHLVKVASNGVRCKSFSMAFYVIC